MRGAKQRQARRSTFRSNGPAKKDLWSKEEQEKRDKETAEWEKGPEEDRTVEGLTQTGEEKEEEENDVEMTQAEGRATAIWMEEGRNLLVGGRRQEFTFLGKEGRRGKELTLSTVHSHMCKWDAQTMHLPPIDIGVPEDQRYKALRTQVTQQVERLGCKCYIAFEERRMRKWLEGQEKETKQAWVIVMDSEDPRPSEEKIITIFFTKHDQDCKWRGKGELRLNPIKTEKRGGELKREIAKKTNAETEAQGCKCDVDFDTMDNLETEMMMNQGIVNVVIYEEPEGEEELETSQWNEKKDQIQVKATQDGHDTQSQTLPRSRSFTGARTKARKASEPPPPFQTPPEKKGVDAAMEYVIKTMVGVAARSDQMYRGYLDRVAEKEEMMKEIRNEMRKAIEEMRKEIREELRQAKTQEWSRKRKQIPLPPKPGPGSTPTQGEPYPVSSDKEGKVPTPPKVVILKKKEEEGKREAAKGEKKYVAPLPGYDDSNESSGSTPLWSKIAATKGEWTTVSKKQQTRTLATQEKSKKSPEEAIRGRNIIIERPKAYKNTKINEQVLRDSINGAIRATAATARITLVKITGSGNIAIRTDEEHTAEDIWIHRKRIETTISKILQHAFELRKDYEREFIKVDSIKLSYANGGGRNWKRTDWNSTTLHALRTDLELSNRGVIVMERPQFIESLRRMEEEGRTTATGVFAVAKTQELKDILRKGRITLTAKEHNCRKWDNEPYTTICEKCLERGHSRGACGGPAKCRYCGGRHMSENHQCKAAGCDAKRAQLCRHHPKKCTKCGSNQHFGDDPNCSFTPSPTPRQEEEKPQRNEEGERSPGIILTPPSPEPQQEQEEERREQGGLTPPDQNQQTNKGRKRTQTEEQTED